MSTITITLDLGTSSVDDLRTVLASHGYQVIGEEDSDGKALSNGGSKLHEWPECLPPLSKREKSFVLKRPCIVAEQANLVPRLLAGGYTLLYTSCSHSADSVWIRVVDGHVHLLIRRARRYTLLWYSTDSFLRHWKQVQPKKGRGIVSHIRYALLAKVDRLAGRTNCQILDNKGEYYGEVWFDICEEQAMRFMNLT